MLRLRSLVLLGVLIPVGLAVAPAVAAPKVLVVASRRSDVMTSKSEVPDQARARRDISGTVSIAVGTTGAEIADAAPLAGAGLAECTTPECAHRIGAVTGASFVLIVDARFDLDRFEVRLDIWNASSGGHVDGEGDMCDGCSHADFLRSLRARATLLCERTFRAATTVRSATPAPTGVALLAPPVSSPQPPQARSEAARWIGGGLIGAGVLAGVASGLLFAIHNNKIDCAAPPGDPDPCVERRNTLAPAILSGAAAVVAVSAGVMVLGFGSGKHRMSLSVQPHGLALGGAPVTVRCRGLTAVVVLAMVGCAELRPGRCHVDADCPAGLVCSQAFVAGVYHRCVPLNDGGADRADVNSVPDGDAEARMDAGSDVDTAVDVPPPTCLTEGCPNPTVPVCDPDAATCVQCLHGATDCTTPKPVCDTTAKICVACLLSKTDCGGVAPICDAQDCRACRSDGECATALGPDPGLCMPDGHCADSGEVVYAIQPTTTDCGTADGTLTKPFCTAQAALDSARTSGKAIVVLRGGFGSFTVTSTAAQVSIIGQNGAGMNPGGNLYGVDVSGTASILLRGVTISGGTSTSGGGAHVTGSSASLTLISVQITGNVGAGVAAESGGMIVMDRCVVKGTGGLAPPALKATASPFHITNSVFANSSIGANLDMIPPSGNPLFQNNTVVTNAVGLTCTGAISAIPLSGLILFGNTTAAIGCNPPACCSGDPQLTADYHLMAASPCIDQLAADPLVTHDIDGDPRPVGTKSDCGADEFRTP